MDVSRLYRPGQVVTKIGAFAYRCPICGARRTHDDAYGLACTGPSETRDEHPMTMMDPVGRT